METLNLKDGTLSFDQSHIYIEDKNKHQSQIRTLSSSLWLLFGVLFVWRYFLGEEAFYLWSGLFIAVGHGLVLIIQSFFRTSRGDIPFADIKAMHIKRRGNNTFLELKLRNNRSRRVNQVEEIEPELQTLIQNHAQAVG